MPRGPSPRRSRFQESRGRGALVALGRIVFGRQEVETSQKQLDAYRRIENAETHHGGKEAYPGGPPRTIDLTAGESPRSESAFHDTPR